MLSQKQLYKIRVWALKEQAKGDGGKENSQKLEEETLGGTKAQKGKLSSSGLPWRARESKINVPTEITNNKRR